MRISIKICYSGRQIQIFVGDQSKILVNFDENQEEYVVQIINNVMCRKQEIKNESQRN